ncbi:hypothetical protein EYF80_010154 [Liparis tanakae]|uniref:Uncharacterized protein n=1 Tax=Liparis tanakae TaxID=230148 RepID=A0A4Z2IQR9_9TELE|nr:hypothetical protein EYF80_010154 [Liparis tanakae]
MRSSGGEPRESSEKREGEPERMCSLAESDLPNASGLAADEREEELWGWMLRTKGRTENPPGERGTAQEVTGVIGNSTDSASEAREVRLDEAPEARLAGRLPGSLLTQWSHSEELVEPEEQPTNQNAPRASEARHRETFETPHEVGDGRRHGDQWEGRLQLLWLRFTT